MSIYFYLIIWGFGGCLVGICIGFFFAVLLAQGGTTSRVNSLIDENERLNNTVLEKTDKIINLNNQLTEIRTIVQKHFGA